MTEIKETLAALIGARPLGSTANHRAVEYLEKKAIAMGYEVTLLPLTCNLWEGKPSFLERGGRLFSVIPSPFSRPFEGAGPVVRIGTVAELQNLQVDLGDKILLLAGEIAKEPFQPKDFPFYYPDEHKQVIDLLEEKKPLAILAVTGKHPMVGLNPFPLFEDGNFHVPSAYMTEETATILFPKDDPISLEIHSEVRPGQSHQLIATRKSRGAAQKRIIVCAHLDTKYDTPGALDNTAGIAVLAGIMERLRNEGGPYEMEFIPFNGEEYYEVKGELAYLKHRAINEKEIKLVINIDSLGYKNAPTALSHYNFSDRMVADLNTKLKNNSDLTMGSPWYAGDHAMFARQGIPCLTVTSADLFENVKKLIHTPEDNIDHIDDALLEKTADFLTEVILEASEDI